MFPILQSKDLVFYKKNDFLEIRMGNFVLVKKGGELLTHEVIYRTKNYLITKGNNNFQSDGKIYPKQFIAKAYRVKRDNNKFDPQNIYPFQTTLYS